MMAAFEPDDADKHLLHEHRQELAAVGLVGVMDEVG